MLSLVRRLIESIKQVLVARIISRNTWSLAQGERDPYRFVFGRIECIKQAVGSIDHKIAANNLTIIQCDRMSWLGVFVDD